MADNMIEYGERRPNISSFVPEFKGFAPKMREELNFIDLLPPKEVHMETRDSNSERLGYSLVYAGIGILCVCVIYLIEVVIKLIV